MMTSEALVHIRNLRFGARHYLIQYIISGSAQNMCARVCVGVRGAHFMEPANRRRFSPAGQHFEEIFPDIIT